MRSLVPTHQNFYVDSMLQVAAAIIVQKGKILIGRRRKTDHLPLKWEFPGGKVHSDETPETCLVRELKEELAITAEIGEKLTEVTYTYPQFGTVQIHFFPVTRFSGRLENRAYEQIAWVNPAELPDYDFLEADRTFIQGLARGTVTGSSSGRGDLPVRRSKKHL